MARARRLETLAVHAGHEPDPTTGAVTPAIHLSTTFERDADGGLSRGYLYGRLDNPTRRGLEVALAALEGGAQAVAFSSGQAAATAVVHALQAGDHVIAPRDMYYGAANILRQLGGRAGVATSFVDMTRLEEVRAAVRPATRLVWIETPSNPMLRCVDVAGAAEIARAAGARAIVDNTFASPVLQRPFELGADVVLHSTTKYIGGRSDALGGAVIVREEDGFAAAIRGHQQLAGAVPSPFECWLVMRSLPTLPCRVRAQCEGALRIAEAIRSDPRVAAVHYPGLADSPYHALARRQMRGFGGVVSFEVAGGAAAARAVVGRVELFTRATSLGGVESSIEHRASVEGPESATPPGLLRVSVGLEHPDDLVEDLAQALSAAG